MHTNPLPIYLIPREHPTGVQWGKVYQQHRVTPYRNLHPQVALKAGDTGRLHLDRVDYPVIFSDEVVAGGQYRVRHKEALVYQLRL